MATESVLATGLVERVTFKDGIITMKRFDGKKYTAEHQDYPDHKVALHAALDTLLDPEYGVIKSMSEINAVGHRVVHGGEKFTSSVLIDDEVEKAIRDTFELAPLHNPPNMMGIEASLDVMPEIPNVAVFDTTFHTTIPKYAYIYALPYSMYEKYGIRKYGFHGTSHLYVSRRAAAMLGKPLEETKVITCHMGNGSSITAVKAENPLRQPWASLRSKELQWVPGAVQLTPQSFPS